MEQEITIITIYNPSKRQKINACFSSCSTLFWDLCKHILPNMFTYVLIGILTTIAVCLGLCLIFWCVGGLFYVVGNILISHGLVCDETVSWCFFPLSHGVNNIHELRILCGAFMVLISMFEFGIYFMIKLIMYHNVIQNIFSENCLINDVVDKFHNIIQKNNKKYYIVNIGKQDSESKQYSCTIIRKYNYILHLISYVLIFIITDAIVMMTNTFFTYISISFLVLIICDLPLHLLLDNVCPEMIKQLFEKINICD